MEEPPDPLPMPIVFVDEGRPCNRSFVPSEAMIKALQEHTYKFISRLALGYENFTCDDALVREHFAIFRP
jgi:hypothetical protein